MEGLKELRQDFNDSEIATVEMAVNQIIERYNQRIEDKEYDRVMRIGIDGDFNLVEIGIVKVDEFAILNIIGEPLIRGDEIPNFCVDYLEKIVNVFDADEGYRAIYDDCGTVAIIQILP